MDKAAAYVVFGFKLIAGHVSFDGHCISSVVVSVCRASRYEFTHTNKGMLVIWISLEEKLNSIYAFIRFLKINNIIYLKDLLVILITDFFG